MAVVVAMDDDPAIVRLLQTIVEADGHTAYTAENVAGAWALLESKHPDVMLLDVDLPNETGVDLVIRMRRDPRFAKVPVIFVTAYRERARPLQATGRGAAVIINKPFSLQEVTSALGQVLSDARRAAAG